jgi:polysaccharide biosynthesis/export protein
MKKLSQTGKMLGAFVLVIAFAVMQAASVAQGTAPPQKNSSQTPATASVAPTYVIHPEDVLDVSVWNQPNLSFKGLPVRPDGKISLPLINDVQAAGLTAMQLGQSITQKLKSYVKDPLVTVVVTGVNSQRYYVLGEVGHAGVFPLLPGLTALQALSAAGGFSQFANPKKIYILRDVNGKEVKFPFNYKDVIKGKNLQQNIFLKPGDEIVVP